MFQRAGLQQSDTASGRSGHFLALAFDGTSTWWNRGFISMAVAFQLGGVAVSKMVALLEKIEVTTEVGAKGYVAAIKGWVEEVRSLQQRLGER